MTASPKVQIACYPGAGTGYRPHQDNSVRAGGGSASPSPSSDERENWRVITVIAYANQDWQPAQGGELRLFDAQNRCGGTGPSCAHAAPCDGGGVKHYGVQDALACHDCADALVEPKCGTIVAFDSLLRHEVRPTWSPRFALTLWLWVEPDCEQERAAATRLEQFARSL